MLNSVLITRLALDPEPFDELVEKLPSEVFEQLTHNWGKESEMLARGEKEKLHWHAIAAEWGNVVKGNVRTTVISPNGEAGQDDFGPARSSRPSGRSCRLSDAHRLGRSILTNLEKSQIHFL